MERCHFCRAREEDPRKAARVQVTMDLTTMTDIASEIPGEHVQLVPGGVEQVPIPRCKRCAGLHLRPALTSFGVGLPVILGGAAWLSTFDSARIVADKAPFYVIFFGIALLFAGYAFGYALCVIEFPSRKQAIKYLARQIKAQNQSAVTTHRR